MSLAIILTFTSIEFMDYRQVNTETSILVDRSMGQKLTIRFNITFPKVPCYRMSIPSSRWTLHLVVSSLEFGYHGHKRRTATGYLSRCGEDSS
jgi:Endoplasmic Reticulum-Golgi Intermediate Compartment (ERGIC)